MSDGSKLCPACGAHNPETNAYCNRCGSRLESAQTVAGVTCPNCGTVNEGPGAFCSECGARLPAPPPPVPAAAPSAAWGSPPPPPATPPAGYDPSPFAAAPAAPFRQEIQGYASFWRRLAAIILDGLILMIPLGTVTVIFLLIDDTLGDIVGWLGSALYFWIMNSFGGTLGKRILGIRVIDETGSAPGLGKGFIRAVIPSWLGIITVASGAGTIGLGFLAFAISLLQLFDGLWVIWDAHKQALHDKMAGTRVIKLP